MTDAQLDALIAEGSADALAGYKSPVAQGNARAAIEERRRRHPLNATPSTKASA